MLKIHTAYRYDFWKCRRITENSLVGCHSWGIPRRNRFCTKRDFLEGNLLACTLGTILRAAKKPFGASLICRDTSKVHADDLTERRAV